MTTQLPQPCLQSLFSIGPHCLLGSGLCCLCCKLPSSPPLHSAWAQRSRTPVCVLKGSGGILGPWLTTPLSFMLHRPLRPTFNPPLGLACGVASARMHLIPGSSPQSSPLGFPSPQWPCSVHRQPGPSGLPHSWGNDRRMGWIRAQSSGL